MALKLAICTAVLEPRSELIKRCLQSWWDTATIHDSQQETEIRVNTPEDNLGVTGSLQWLYEHTTAPIIAYLHSDVELLEPDWDRRVLAEFDNPAVGIVGFGGALQHGSEDIFKTPYRLQQLARLGYLSNTTDAEAHGTRFTASCDVAVLDGFALVVRRSLLDRVGGWPVKECPWHSYDYWCCIAAHKLNYKIRLVGVLSTHHGGTTSTTPQAQEHWLKTLGKTDQQLHEESHKFIYNYGRGFLPWRCK